MNNFTIINHKINNRLDFSLEKMRLVCDFEKWMFLKMFFIHILMFTKSQ